MQRPLQVMVRPVSSSFSLHVDDWRGRVRVSYELLTSNGRFLTPGWVEGIRLSDGERGWFPKTYVEEITSRSARLRNLRENIRIKCVTKKLEGED